MCLLGYIGSSRVKGAPRNGVIIYGFVHTLHSKDFCFFVTGGRSWVCAPDSGILARINSIRLDSSYQWHRYDIATAIAKNTVGYAWSAWPAYRHQGKSSLEGRSSRLHGIGCGVFD